MISFYVSKLFLCWFSTKITVLTIFSLQVLTVVQATLESKHQEMTGSDILYMVGSASSTSTMVRW